MIGRANAEVGIKLYLEVSLIADLLAKRSSEFSAISYELMTQAFALYEESVSDSKVQYRCVSRMIGTLLSVVSLSKEDYEGLITKTAQFSAKLLKKADQCELVAQCAYLFYPVDASNNASKYSNPQRALECLQRSLKLADACTSANAGNVGLFVDLLEHYVFFFEKKNPVISHSYITGLVSLIKEHFNTLSDDSGVAQAKTHFAELVRYIKAKKSNDSSSELFSPVQVNM
jgi:vacuolar protein sorting-associated protein 35